MLVQSIPQMNNYQIGSCNMVRIHKNFPASNIKDSVNISFKGVDECVLAAYNGDLARVRYEVRTNGVDINDCHSFDSYFDTSNKTSLWAAVWHHHYDIVDWLMSQKDIDPNADYDYYNPLATAAYLRDKSSFMRILSHPETDPNLSYKYDKCWGWSNDTLGFVIENKDKEMFEALLNHPKIKPTMEHIKLAKKLNNEDIATRLINHPNFVLDVSELKKDPDFAPYINIGLALMQKDIKQNEEKLAKEKKAVEDAQKALEQREENVKKAEAAFKTEKDEFDETIKNRTIEIRKEEEQKAEQAYSLRNAALDSRKKRLDARAKKLKEDKAALAQGKETLAELMGNFDGMVAEEVAKLMEEHASALMISYGVNVPEKLPENMKYIDQVTYVMGVLVPRQEKLDNVNDDMPETITKELQDASGNISSMGLKFLENIIDLSPVNCSEQDLKDAIKAVKGNYGLFDTSKVRLFTNTLLWGKNKTIQSAIQKVQKLAV